MQLNDVVMEVVADEGDPFVTKTSGFTVHLGKPTQKAAHSQVAAGCVPAWIEQKERPLEAAISGAVAGERIMVSDPNAAGISDISASAQTLQTTLANLHLKHDSLEKRLDEWIISLMEQQSRIVTGIEEIGAHITRPLVTPGRLSLSREAAGVLKRTKTPDVGDCGFSDDGSVAVNGSGAHCEAASTFERQESNFAAKLEQAVKQGGGAHMIRRQSARISCILGKELQKDMDGARASQSSQKTFHSDTTLKTIVQDPAFDSLCAFVIIVYTVLLGFSVEQARMVMGLEKTIGFVSYGCNLFFFIELCLRMKVAGCRKHFTGEDKNWNLFDFSLVLLSVMDLVAMMMTMMDDSSDGNEDTGRLLSAIKILKMMRIVRTFRMFRFFRELALLTLMITDSLKSLMWAIIMLIIITYVFAIVFTQVCYDYMDKGGGPQEFPELDESFGSLPTSIYSLIQAMLGGINWGLVCNVLIGIGSVDSVVMVALFLFYIAFTTLAVLNIITGVFVDNAMENTKTQREFLIQAQMEAREKHLRQLRDIFIAMDDDGDFVLTYQELENSLQDESVRTHFQALDLDPSDMKRLFGLLDEDGSGEVFLEEFLDGCLRLKGGARSIDVHAILWECKRLAAKLDHLQGQRSSENGCH